MAALNNRFRPRFGVFRCNPEPALFELRPRRYIRVGFFGGSGHVGRVLRVVVVGAEGAEQTTEVMKINRPNSLGNLADPLI